MKKVSVIIPVYKVEEYISKCMESVLNQTHTNLEIILVDDGSPDNSGKMCDEFALRDQRVKVIHKENGGVSSARNVALDVVSGDYVAFIDSDDYIDEKHIENLVLLSEETETQMQICGHFVVDEQENKRIQNLNGVQEILCQKDAVGKLMSSQFYCGFLWNKLYSTKVIRDCNLRFDTSISIAEDLLFNLRYMSKIDKVIYNPTPTYYYLQRISSATNSKVLTEKKLSAIVAYEKISEESAKIDEKASSLARATLYNLSIRYLYLYDLSSVEDGSWKTKLKSNIKRNYKDFLRSTNYGVGYKLLGIIARFLPKLYCKIQKSRER